MTSSNQQTLDTYNNNVPKYIERTPQTVSGAVKTWIDSSLARLPSSARILEVGSGPGRDADYIEAKGYRVDRTDASQTFVDHMISRGSKARLLNLLTDNLGKNYDMVFANAVLLHFDKADTEKVIHKVSAALKPGGYFVFSLKVGEGQEMTSRKLDSIRFFRYWTKETVTDLLKMLGFDNVEIVIVHDRRGSERPDWLHITARKAAA
jgi:predicted TPR repeat methyltransferase